MEEKAAEGDRPINCRRKGVISGEKAGGRRRKKKRTAVIRLLLLLLPFWRQVKKVTRRIEDDEREKSEGPLGLEMDGSLATLHY